MLLAIIVRLWPASISKQHDEQILDSVKGHCLIYLILDQRVSHSQPKLAIRRHVIDDILPLVHCYVPVPHHLSHRCLWVFIDDSTTRTLISFSLCCQGTVKYSRRHRLPNASSGSRETTPGKQVKTHTSSKVVI
jgi:hypothetical protein